MTVLEALEVQHDQAVANATAELGKISELTPVADAVPRIARRLGVAERAVREAVMDCLYMGTLKMTSDRRIGPSETRKRA